MCIRDSLGCVAGYLGGAADRTIMFIGEIIACFPSAMLVLIIQGFSDQGIPVTVSYTHLDVYKRQPHGRAPFLYSSGVTPVICLKT